jgi:hypothetical protein
MHVSVLFSVGAVKVFYRPFEEKNFTGRLNNRPIIARWHVEHRPLTRTVQKDSIEIKR